MFRKFKQFISDNQLFSFADKILLAVSGGPDSVVLADLAHKSNLNFAISHVNFHLRGDDSNQDEAFVRNLAVKYNVPIFVLSVDTNSYAKANGLSIEMAARELRYNEFERIMNSENFKVTAVAHHLDDAIETFFLNLTRGSGIKGLTGIKVKNNRIVRPMLCFTRKEIEQYINDNNLQFRIDKTNFDTEFSRNKIRNQIIPAFEQINPSFRQNAALSLKYLSQAKDLYVSQIEKQKEKILKRVSDEYIIEISDIQSFEQPECLLFEIVNQFGFNRAQSDDIFKNLDAESGRIFVSDTHKILKDRNSLIISELKASDNDFSLNIEKDDIINGTKNSLLHTYYFNVIEKSEFHPVRDCKTVYYDFEKLVFPLKITNWNPGDTFVPFGENYNKKLSDFFVDNKLNINQKHEIELLKSAERIIWIVGMRASNLFKVSRQTTKILKITIN